MIGPKKWYFGFAANSGTREDWWRWTINWPFPTNRFAHVVAFRYDPDVREWLYVEWTQEGFYIDIAERKIIDSLIAFLHTSGGEILEYVPKDKPRHMPLIRYCAPIMASLANVSGWIITADHLFRALQKNGAKVAFSGSQPLEEHHHGQR